MLARRRIARIKRRDGRTQYLIYIPKEFAEGRREVIIYYNSDVLLVIPEESLKNRGICEEVERVVGEILLDC